MENIGSLNKQMKTNYGKHWLTKEANFDTSIMILKETYYGKHWLNK